MVKTTYLMSLVITSFSNFSLASENINYYVISQQAKPFQIEENGEHHRGLVTDIVHSIFSGSPYNINYHTYPFNRMISILEEGGEDNWITYGSPNWGGVQAVNLSEYPIYNVKHSLVTTKNSKKTQNSAVDIKGKIIVLLHGFDYPNLTPYIQNGSIEELRVKDYTAAFRVLKKIPKDTAFVEMNLRIKYNLTKNGLNSDHYTLQPFDAIIPDYPIYLALSPNMSPEIQQLINRRLKEMHQSGKIKRIVSRYL